MLDVSKLKAMPSENVTSAEFENKICRAISLNLNFDKVRISAEGTLSGL